MQFAELNLEQRRRLVDIRQAFEVWRAAKIEFRHSYSRSPRWRTIAGREYLYKGKPERVCGPRNEQTERFMREFIERRSRLKERIDTLGERLDGMARVTRAMGLGRVPAMAARILRSLDSEGLLGRHLFVVGTHAMFGYEAASGVLFDANLTETQDLGLLWDVRRRLTLALFDARTEGVMGLLKKIDRSFEAQRNSFRAVNAEGYFVDLIRPFNKDEMHKPATGIGDAADDLEAAALSGLEWLVINAPKFDQTVIDAAGKPLFMSCADPRVFALHKYFVSQEASRDPLKRRRDMAQAKAVAAVAADYLGLSFQAPELSAVPRQLVEEAPRLLAAA
jgi:hypothetical protein